jgi:hypothetical protein
VANAGGRLHPTACFGASNRGRSKRTFPSLKRVRLRIHPIHLNILAIRMPKVLSPMECLRRQGKMTSWNCLARMDSALGGPKCPFHLRIRGISSGICPGSIWRTGHLQDFLLSLCNDRCRPVVVPGMGIRIDLITRNVMVHEGSGIGVLCGVVMMTTEGRIRHGAMMERGRGMCIGTETGSEGEGRTHMSLRTGGAHLAVVLAAPPFAGESVPPLVAATFTDQFHHNGGMMEVDLSGLGRPAVNTTLTLVYDPVPERHLAGKGGWSTAYQNVGDIPRLFFNLVA